MTDNSKILKRIEEAIKNSETNNFTLFFFVIDCKNVPNSNMFYIYQMAKTLYDNGYNVKMLYQMDKEYTVEELEKLERKQQYIDENRRFVGVREWLGDEYANIPHMNISDGKWAVSPSDFLFIPEAFASLMQQTYKFKAPCRRFVILQNYDYVTDFIPLGVEWKNYGIFDAITSTDKQAELIKSVFPYMRTRTINPCIPDMFRKPITPHKLYVNIVAKKQSDVGKFIRTFYWKYPMYKFISFKDVRNLKQDVYAETLKEGAITVWMDDETPFGYAPLEAMRCGNIVVGKIPEMIPEWMQDEEGIINNGFWTYDKMSLPDALSKVLTLWMNDEIPQELTDSVEETNKKYTQKQWNKNVVSMMKELVDDRITEFKNIKEQASVNNDNKTEEA